MDFLEEYKKLMKNCPHPGFKQDGVENSEYTDYTEHTKNCYYVFDAGAVEDTYYSDWMGWVKDSADCSHLIQSELCYECVDCQSCYNSDYLLDCSGTRDSAFCHGCVSCENCFLCSGLKHKKFHIMNEEFPKDEYLKKVAELKKKGTDELLKMFDELNSKTPRCFAHAIQCENFVGDFGLFSKNIYYGFDVIKERDDFYVCDWGSISEGNGDNCDCMLGGDSSLCYECCYLTYSYNCNFATKCDRCVDCEFCEECYECKNCFGCTYLKGKQFYILNEKYEKEEYLKKVEEVKKALKDAGEYCVAVTE